MKNQGSFEKSRTQNLREEGCRVLPQHDKMPNSLLRAFLIVYVNFYAT